MSKRHTVYGGMERDGEAVRQSDKSRQEMGHFACIPGFILRLVEQSLCVPGVTEGEEKGNNQKLLVQRVER